MFLSLVAVGVTIWAISASVMASNRKKECEALTREKEALSVQCDQIKQESMIRVAEAEKLRQTAMEWTRQHQLQIQAEMRKKAEEAAKAAKAKDEAAKKATAVKAKTTPVKKAPAKAAPVKKTTHKSHS